MARYGYDYCSNPEQQVPSGETAGGRRRGRDCAAPAGTLDLGGRGGRLLPAAGWEPAGAARLGPAGWDPGVGAGTRHLAGNIPPHASASIDRAAELSLRAAGGLPGSD